VFGQRAVALQGGEVFGGLVCRREIVANEEARRVYLGEDFELH